MKPADCRPEPTGKPPAFDDQIPDDPRVIEVVEEYLGKLEQGLHPDYDEYLRRYPEFAEAVARCLEGLDIVRKAMPTQPALDAADEPGRGLISGVEGQAGPLGDFQIVRELGRGGMGIVYEAIQISLGRRVALKVLPFASTFDSRQLQRFKNEAQAAALLHHTHIVPIYAVGCERGVHFYAMQLIEGQSLAVIIRQLREQSGAGSGATGSQRDSQNAMALGGGLEQGARAAELRPAHELALSTLNVSAALTTGASLTSTGYFRKIARLIVQAAEALEHAHQLGVVHRDVKPANLLVNASGNLWVTDFGLAQLQADNGLTRSGDLLGTFRYMSPEQTSGQRAVLDHRTDIYSLGATFYELLTLEPVFDGETRQELLYQILHQEPRLPRQVNRAIPVELETIVLKALSKTPADRYATAAEMAADVQRYLDDQPIKARRPSLVDRVRKWSRRHPSAVIATALLSVVVAVSLLISNRLISREQERTTEALQRETSRAHAAEAQLQQARRAIDVLLSMSEKELANEPMLQGGRLQLLQAALDYYQSFVDQARDHVAWQPDVWSMRDRVERMLGDLTVLKDEATIVNQQLAMTLLWSPSVLDDLGLTQEQREQVGRLRESWTDACHRAFAETAAGDGDAQRRRFVAISEEYARLADDLLSTQQFERIEQISIQCGVMFAFNGPQALAWLKMPAGPLVAVRTCEVRGGDGRSRSTARGPARTIRGQIRDVPPLDAVLCLLDTLTRDWSKTSGRPVGAVPEPRSTQNQALPSSVGSSPPGQPPE
ncbi:MAG: serine/threonine protein kinase [Planctomycetaceae bacterium]